MTELVGTPNARIVMTEEIAGSKEWWVTEYPAEVRNLIEDADTEMIELHRIIAMKAEPFFTRPGNIVTVTEAR